LKAATAKVVFIFVHCGPFFLLLFLVFWAVLC